ncbi:hypothetical protein BU15DRAFT_65570 [Melanogaster broomeanus]|nr:hypothetical protein BU15DRAFT_65570 [Melanogaster broomeanus]
MWASQPSPLDIPRPAMSVSKLLYGHPKLPLGHPKLHPGYPNCSCGHPNFSLDIQNCIQTTGSICCQWISKLIQATIWASQTSTGASQTPTLDIPIATVGIPWMPLGTIGS